MTNETITLNLLVDPKYDELFVDYHGNYSVTISVVDALNEENDYFLNNEPIFVKENGNKSKCIWKQDNDTWWIGNCGEIGQNQGFAYMNNCKCPWPR